MNKRDEWAFIDEYWAFPRKIRTPCWGYPFLSHRPPWISTNIFIKSPSPLHIRRYFRSPPGYPPIYSNNPLVIHGHFLYRTPWVSGILNRRSTEYFWKSPLRFNFSKMIVANRFFNTIDINHIQKKKRSHLQQY